MQEEAEYRKRCCFQPLFKLTLYTFLVVYFVLCFTCACLRQIKSNQLQFIFAGVSLLKVSNEQAVTFVKSCPVRRIVIKWLLFCLCCNFNWSLQPFSRIWEIFSSRAVSVTRFSDTLRLCGILAVMETQLQTATAWIRPVPASCSQNSR